MTLLAPLSGDVTNPFASASSATATSNARIILVPTISFDDVWVIEGPLWKGLNPTGPNFGSGKFASDRITMAAKELAIPIYLRTDPLEVPVDIYWLEDL